MSISSRWPHDRPRRRPQPPHRSRVPAGARRGCRRRRRRPSPPRRPARSTSARLSWSRPATGSRPTPSSTGSTAASRRSPSCSPPGRVFPLDELTPHLYVHYDERAVQHLFSVVCGLDSMVVGEAQILGQVRLALREAQERGTAGKQLGGLFQDALRVGQARPRRDGHRPRRVARWSPLALDVGGCRARPVSRRCRVLLVGAGSMSGLAAATLQRAGVTDLTVVNRTAEHGERLAGRLGGRTAGPRRAPEALAEADLVVSCTGAVGHVVTHETYAAAHALARGTGCRSTAGAPRPRAASRRRPRCGSSAGSHGHRPRAARRPAGGRRERGRTSKPYAAIVAEEVAVHVAARAVGQRRAHRRRAAQPGRGRRGRRAGPPRRPLARPRPRRTSRGRADRPTAPSTSCCTSRPCGSRSSPPTATRWPTPRRCTRSSTSTRSRRVGRPGRRRARPAPRDGRRPGMSALRLGTRRSPLALAQSQAVVAAALTRCHRP